MESLGEQQAMESARTYWTRRRFLGAGAATLAGLMLLTIRLRAADRIGALPRLRIVFFTDVHAMVENEAAQKMQQTAEMIAAVPADLVIGGGDYLHGGFGSTALEMQDRIEIFRDFQRQLGNPFRAVIGNHDLVGALPENGAPPAANPRQTILEILGMESAFYAFDVKEYRFFVVDSVEIVGGPTRYRGFVAEAQLAWLREELRKTPKDQPLVLCSHIPLRTTFIQEREQPTAPLPPNLVVENANELLALFADHRLVLVLQGHLHSDEQIRWNGVEFVMGGAVSGAWWKGDNRGTSPGFGVVELGSSPAGWEYRSPKFG